MPLPEDVQIVQDIEIGSYGGTFILAESTEPKTFNFFVPSDAVSSKIQGYLSSGLMSWNQQKQEFEPGLAKSYQVSEDGRTYTFTIRKGIKWSDGTPLTVHDLAFVFEVIFAKQTNENGDVILSESGAPKYKFPTRYFASLTIGGQELTYEVLDDYTIRFTTATVYAPFLSSVAGMPFLPEHKLRPYFEDGTIMQQWSSELAINNPHEFVSCGPFVIDSFRPGENIVMTPNPHYWKADVSGQRLPYVDYLITKFVNDGNATTILFSTGQLSADGVGATDEPWVARASETYDFTIHNQGPGASISFLFFNQHPGVDSEGVPYLEKKKYNWFSNKKFRQAIMYSFDREGVSKGVYLGRARPLHSVIAPGNIKWHNPNTKKYSYQPYLAKQILLEEGFYYQDKLLFDAEGNQVTWELTAFEGAEKLTSTLTIFKENLAAIGIEIDLKFIDFGALIQRITNTFAYDQAVIGWGSSAGAGDPNGSKALYRSSGKYHMWYPEQSEPATEWERRVDQLVDQQEQTLDFKERQKLIFEIQEIFAEELPMKLLVTGDAYSGIQNKWGNVKVPPTGDIEWNLDELFLIPLRE